MLNFSRSEIGYPRDAVFLYEIFCSQPKKRTSRARQTRNALNINLTESECAMHTYTCNTRSTSRLSGYHPTARPRRFQANEIYYRPHATLIPFSPVHNTCKKKLLCKTAVSHATEYSREPYMCVAINLPLI